MKRMVLRARRLIIAVIGVTVLLIGIAMIILPGPAVLVIPAGIAILATEFVWAKRMLEQVKRGGVRELRAAAMQAWRPEPHRPEPPPKAERPDHLPTP